MLRETGSSGVRGGGSSITLQGTADEIDAVRRMLNGAAWLRVDDNDPARPVVVADWYKPLPDPVDDPHVPPKWMLPPVGKCTQADLDKAPSFTANVAPELDPTNGQHYPSFYVKGLGGYTGNYAHYVKVMAAVGFECMRSRRGKDGRFLEVWYLSCPDAARGALADVVKDAGGAVSDWKIVAHAVINWLCQKVEFGSAEVVVQRAALVID